MKVMFANNIDKDILIALDEDTIPTEPITDNNIKCSKSVVPNALYYISKGEKVEFILGAFDDPNVRPTKSMITHCWIEHNGEIAQTHVPNYEVKLIKNFSYELSSDVEVAKEEIRELIHLISN